MISAFAAEGKNGTYEINVSGTQEIIREQQPLPVVIDHSGVTVFERGKKMSAGKKNLSRSAKNRLARWTKRPASSLAAKYGRESLTQEIRWTPLWSPGSTSGISVTDAALSQDKSVIVFIETIGASDGPFGTRIILYDTHAWEILQAADLESVYAKKGLWASDGKLILLCAGQKTRNTRDSIAVYDPLSKKIVSLFPLKFSAGTLFAGSGEYFLLSEKGSANIHLYFYSDSSIQKRKMFQPNSPMSALAFDRSGLLFFMANGKALLTGRVLDQRIIGKDDLELDFVPKTIFPLEQKACLILPGADTGKYAYYRKNGKGNVIGGPTSGIALPGFRKDSFFAGFAKQGEFAEYVYPGLDRIREFSANGAKPKTQGSPLFAFTIPHAKAVAVMDSRGIFYLLFPDPGGKKWQKEILTKQQK